MIFWTKVTVGIQVLLLENVAKEHEIKTNLYVYRVVGDSRSKSWTRSLRVWLNWNKANLMKRRENKDSEMFNEIVL